MLLAPGYLLAGRAGALAVFRAPFILSLALPGSVVMFGVVTRMLGFPLEYALPFFAVGMTLIAARFPTWDRVLAPVERARNVQIPRP